jgi:CDP-4-dehydro-6-deoxyglucose reductase
MINTEKYTVTLNNGVEFACNNNVSLLDAAAAAGVTFPYSCRTGRCSSCKCKVLSGYTACLNAELGLTDKEVASGWVLACVRTAISNLRLDAYTLGDFDIPAPQTLPCRIHEIKRLAPDVLSVKLRLPPSVEFRFLPGQYIDVIGPGGKRRSYSLANSDATEKILELHIRLINDGLFSAYWFETAKVNDLLRLHGPLGTFFLRGVKGKGLVFLATGTGLAPVKSILGGLFEIPPEDWPESISVYWGGRTSSDLYFNLDFPFKLFNYIPVLSRPEPSWDGEVGYVQDVLLSKHTDLGNTMVYACGSDAMIKSAEAKLTAAGLPEGYFMSDAFVCSARL